MVGSVIVRELQQSAGVTPVLLLLCVWDWKPSPGNLVAGEQREPLEWVECTLMADSMFEPKANHSWCLAQHSRLQMDSDLAHGSWLTCTVVGVEGQGHTLLRGTILNRTKYC